MTDSGNFILDCAFGRIDEPEALDEALKLIPGVVENGLFLGIADRGHHRRPRWRDARSAPRRGDEVIAIE